MGTRCPVPLGPTYMRKFLKGKLAFEELCLMYVGTRWSGTIRAYLHEKVVKVSWFEELCPVCGDKVSGYHYGLLT